MANKQKHDEVRSRNEPFSPRTATRIWHEHPSESNPYITQSALCHGYDLVELMQKRSFVDVFYLLFRGELPSTGDAGILQALMIALINPGPRHPATRAAMNAGVGKTNPVHILPIASAVLGGEYMGGSEVEEAMRFFRKFQNTDPNEMLNQVLAKISERGLEVDPIPAFGARYGGIEELSVNIANELKKLPGAGKALRWGCELNSLLQPHGIGWLITGVASAVFADLGFQPRAGGALYQLLGAPGLVAHGLELANKPITAMPFVSDENYVIERKI